MSIYDDTIFEFERLCSLGNPEDAALYLQDKVGTETLTLLIARVVSRQLMLQQTPQTAKLPEAQKVAQEELAAVAVQPAEEVKP